MGAPTSVSKTDLTRVPRYLQDISRYLEDISGMRPGYCRLLLVGQSLVILMTCYLLLTELKMDPLENEILSRVLDTAERQERLRENLAREEREEREGENLEQGEG